ncbi:MAG: hemolysin family protein [Treponema sp.]|nr:hemolysin family protein [Treponema sp.]
MISRRLFLCALSLLIICMAAGFAAMLERALFSVRKTHLKIRAEDGNKKYRLALNIAEHPEIFASALRVCNGFFMSLAGVAGTVGVVCIFMARSERQSGLWEPSDAIGLASLILAAITGFLGGSVFKRIAMYRPEHTVLHFLPLIKCAAFLCAPLFMTNAFFSSRVKKIFNAQGSGRETSQSITEAELRIALREGEKSGIVESAERAMVEGVFYLGDRPAGAFMTHRSEIAWLDINASHDEIMKAAAQFRAQRYFPVADDTLDEVIGVVSVEDILFAFIANPQITLKSIAKPPHFVPETMSALKVIDVFKQKEVDFLFIMDEYGGFAGILSLNDLVEEIVGELSTHSAETDAIVQQSDGSFLVDGSSNIDEIADLLSLSSLIDEHQEYHTIAGFILNLAGEIPSAGASFNYKNFDFTVVDMDGNRIDKVMIVHHAPSSQKEPKRV